MELLSRWMSDRILQPNFFIFLPSKALQQQGRGSVHTCYIVKWKLLPYNIRRCFWAVLVKNLPWMIPQWLSAWFARWRDPQQPPTNCSAAGHSLESLIQSYCCLWGRCSIEEATAGILFWWPWGCHQEKMIDLDQIIPCLSPGAVRSRRNAYFWGRWREWDWRDRLLPRSEPQFLPNHRAPKCTESLFYLLASISRVPRLSVFLPLPSPFGWASAESYHCRFRGNPICLRREGCRRWLQSRIIVYCWWLHWAGSKSGLNVVKNT